MDFSMFHSRVSFEAPFVMGNLAGVSPQTVRSRCPATVISFTFRHGGLKFQKTRATKALTECLSCSEAWQEVPQIEGLPEDEALRCVWGDL